MAHEGSRNGGAWGGLQMNVGCGIIGVALPAGRQRSKRANTSWLCVIFGESHLAVLSLTDVIVRSRYADPPRALEMASVRRASPAVGRWGLHPRTPLQGKCHTAGQARGLSRRVAA